MKNKVLFNGHEYILDVDKALLIQEDLINLLAGELKGKDKKIIINGVVYEIDTQKMSQAKSNFTNYLGTIDGNDKVITVDGVEYGLNQEDAAGAISDIEVTLDNLRGLVPSEGLVFERNGQEYELVSLGTCTDTDIVIPGTYQGLPVRSIDSLVFRGNQNITSIVLPYALTSIDTYEFAGCTNLKAITLGNHIVTIANFAFQDCESLESICIPDSVTTIWDRAFQRCNSLKEVIIGSGVTKIETDAFYYCDSLTDIYINKSQGTVQCERDWCKSTVRVHWNSTGPEVPEEPDEPELTPSEGLEFTLNSDGVSYSLTGTGTCADANIVIPSEYEGLPVTVIDEEAIVNQFVETVVIPDSITTIYYGAIVFCNKLTTIIIGSGLQYCDDGAIMYNDQLKDIYINQIEEESLLKPEQWDSNEGDGKILDYVTIHWNSTGPEVPVEPEVLASEGLEYRLNDDGVSYTVLSVGECEDTDIVIPTTYEGLPVTVIDDSAFCFCDITGITIPDSVISIGDNIFDNCRYLLSITFEGTVDQWRQVEISSGWRAIPATYIQCTDGQVAVPEYTYEGDE